MVDADKGPGSGDRSGGAGFRSNPKNSQAMNQKRVERVIWAILLAGQPTRAAVG